jgi:hypothetical protein
MKKFNNKMFESIKGALNDNKSANSNYSEILRCSPGNTYTVRLVPYLEDTAKTFFHYYNHGWTSFATGQYVQALSLQTFGDRDPIAEERFRLSRMGTEEEKAKAAELRRAEKWLVSVYVVDDPTNEDNNGKVKIFRYGKQIQKIIDEAIEGEDAEEFGARIFDMGPDGVNLKIKVDKQGEYPSYTSSRFTTVGKLNLSDDEIEEVHKSAFDLETVFPAKTVDELKEMFAEHFTCADTDEGTDDSDDTPKPEPKPEPKAKKQPAMKTEKKSDESVLEDDEIEKLLEGIN